jgi:hypothetical protein
LAELRRFIRLYLDKRAAHQAHVSH